MKDLRDLHGAVQRVISDLEAVLATVDAQGAPLRHAHRVTIDMQLKSLRLVDGELHERVVSRRVWALGQATIPILRSMLNAAGKPQVGLPDEIVDHAHRSVEDLRTELKRFAEGR